jgi:hypothetical protein
MNMYEKSIITSKYQTKFTSIAQNSQILVIKNKKFIKFIILHKNSLMPAEKFEGEDT